MAFLELLATLAPVLLLAVYTPQDGTFNDVNVNNIRSSQGPRNPYRPDFGRNGTGLRNLKATDGTGYAQYFPFFRDNSDWRSIGCDCSAYHKLPAPDSQTTLQVVDQTAPQSSVLYYLVDGNNPSEEGSPSDGAYVRIVSAADDTCLDYVNDKRDSDSVQIDWVVTNKCDPAKTSQVWKLVDYGARNTNFYYFFIEAKDKPGQCITPRSMKSNGGTLLHLWNHDTSDWHQMWAFHRYYPDSTCKQPNYSCTVSSECCSKYCKPAGDTFKFGYCFNS